MQFGRPTIKLCALPFLALACLAGQEPASVPTIELRVTVYSKGDGAPANLRREDLRLLEDNKPQELLAIRQENDPPLFLAILFDTSGSQNDIFKYEQQAAYELVDQFLRAGIDQASVVTINTKPQLKQPLTDSKDILKESIKRLAPESAIVFLPGPFPPPTRSGASSPPGGTSLYDSVWFACEEILSKTPESSRRAILVLSDGVDTTSKKKRGEVSDRAIRSRVAIYSIGIGDPGFGGVSSQTLSGLAESTGGRAFYPKPNELQRTVEQLVREFRISFLVSYKSNNLSPVTSGRKLKIEISNPDLRKQKLELAYQRKYFAQ
jgi:VWFA-related protein